MLGEICAHTDSDVFTDSQTFDNLYMLSFRHSNIVLRSSPLEGSAGQRPCRPDYNDLKLTLVIGGIRYKLNRETSSLYCRRIVV